MLTRRAQTSFLSCIAVAGAVVWAAIALDRRMSGRRRQVQSGTSRQNAEPQRQHGAARPRSAVAFSAAAALAAGERAVCDVIRPAGQAAMRDPPPDWDSVDEMVDESFPASDPPGAY